MKSFDIEKSDFIVIKKYKKMSIFLIFISLTSFFKFKLFKNKTYGNLVGPEKRGWQPFRPISVLESGGGRIAPKTVNSAAS